MFRRRRSRFPQVTAVRERLPQQVDKLSGAIGTLSGKLEELPEKLPRTLEHIPDTLERLPRTLERLPHKLEKLPRALEKLPDHLPRRSRRTARKRKLLGVLVLTGTAAFVTFIVVRAFWRAKRNRDLDKRFRTDSWPASRATEPSITPPHGDEIDTSRLAAARAPTSGMTSTLTMPAQNATESLRAAGVSKGQPAPASQSLSTIEPNFDLLAGLPVVDVDDHQVGEVEAVYYRSYRGDPEWIAIRIGLVDPKRVLVPVEGFTTGEKVTIPYTRQQIEDAPVTPEGELTEEQELLCYAHYNTRREMAESVSDDTRLRVWMPADVQKQRGTRTSSKSE